MILAAHNLTLSYPGFREPVLKDISLDIRPGEFVLIAGESGSGKSSLLNCLSGLIPGFLIPQQGEIRICGIAPHCYPAEKRGQTVRMVYQNPDHQLFMPDSLSEVMFPLSVKKGREDDESVETACAIMDRLGLLKLKGRHPHTLSLGEKKRLAIAFALFHKPAVLLLDEPTTGIDKKNVQNLVTLLKEYGSRGTTIVIASHDDTLTKRICHREVVIDPSGR
ncbi:MAG: ABC transporter ATP-binding protein [bacterium]